MNAKDLERHITIHTHFTAAALDHRTRSLRSENLLPSGARGRSAPQINSTEAAHLFMSLGLEKPQDAARAVRTFSIFEEKQASDDGEVAFLGCNFGKALSAILEDAAGQYKVKEVRLCHSWPMATVVFEDGGHTRFGPKDQPQAGFGSLGFVEVVLRGGLLRDITANLQDPGRRGGWVSDNPKAQKAKHRL